MVCTSELLRRLEPVLRSVSDAVVVTTADVNPSRSVVVFVNGAACTLIGLTPNKAVGRPLADLANAQLGRPELPELMRALDASGRGSSGTLAGAGGAWQVVPLVEEGGDVAWLAGIRRSCERARPDAVADATPAAMATDLGWHGNPRTADHAETVIHRLHERIAERDRAEFALRESEQRFRDFASASSDWFWEMGPDLRFTWLSDQFERLTGVSPDKVIGGTREQLGRSDHADPAWAGHLKDLRGRRPFRDFRYRTWRDDGGEVHFSVSGVPVFDAKGRFQGYRGTGTNITAEVQAEKEAEVARVRLREAIESIAEGFMLFDADDRLILFNSTIARSLPRIADMLTPGTTFESIVRAAAERGYIVEALGRIEEWVQDRLRRHRALNSPTEQQFIGGQWIQVNEYRTADGGTLLIRTDISDRKWVEEALRQSEERFQLAVSGTRDGLWDRDLVGGTVWYSPVWRQIIGLDEREMGGYVWREWVHPDDLPRAIRAMEEHFADITPYYRCVYRHRHRDGRWIWIEARGTCVRDDAGRPVRYTGRFSDISQRVEAEERLRKMKGELEHVARLNIMGEMAAGIAHELHQPLTAITNYVQTAHDLLEALNVARSQTVDEAMVRALQQCQRAGQVIQRLRDFMTKGKARRSAQDINVVVEETTSLALVGATDIGLDLQLDLARDLPIVFVDKIQIQQVVANLIRNGLDAMAQSNHRRLVIRTSRGEGAAVAIEISDNGPGISPAVADRLFEPFVTTKPQGTGIGLSICRSIVEDHHGHLTVVSRRDGGATFRFTLPTRSSYLDGNG
ncbi:MAG: PAS domain S-box protein [Rhodospirillales bacterium]